MIYTRLKEEGSAMIDTIDTMVMRAFLSRYLGYVKKPWVNPASYALVAMLVIWARWSIISPLLLVYTAIAYFISPALFIISNDLRGN